MSMREAEEQDTCRICSAPAEPDQPLFHPCKCSGTIRYIHQDCLTTWLAHSKKKNCDVCKHPYSFTKVYAPDMPSRLPPILLARRLAHQGLFGILFVARGIIVATIWLAILPWITVWTWRMYFSMGDSTAWWISDRPRPTPPDSSPFYNRIRHDPAIPLPKSLLGRLSSHPLWLAVSADIFTGQIIASVIVLTFVAVFLLREWISQNARPGVFEDDEVLPEEPPVLAPPPPPAPRAELRPPPLVRDEDLHQRQEEAMRALEEMRTVDGPNGLADANNQPLERLAKKAKGKQPESSQPARIRRRLVSSDSENEFPRERKISDRFKARTSRRPYGTRPAGARRRVIPSSLAQPSVQPEPLPQTAPRDGGFDFTFKVPSSLNNETNDARRSFSEPRSLPYSFSSPNAFPEPSHLRTELRRSEEPSSSNEPFRLSGSARRPPLPTNPLSNYGSNSPFLVSPARSPLESPSLSTYRAPEELEVAAGPSRQPDYFGRSAREAESEVETNHDNTEQEYPALTRERLKELERTLKTYDSDSDSDLDPEKQTPRYLAKADAERRGEFEDDLSDLDSLGSSTPGTRGDEDEEYLPRLIPLDDSDSDEQVQDREPEPILEPDNVAVQQPEERREAWRDFFADAQEDEDEEDEADEDMDVEEEEEEEEPRAAFPPIIEGQIIPPIIGAGDQPNGAELDEMLDINDDAEDGAEDEIEGAMEAIGMRGPIHGVLQNAAIMIFVLDTAIGLGVWIPFTIGKSTALLSLDPHRFFQILHLPIRAIRIITDPIVDNTAHVIVAVLLPAVFRCISSVLRFVSFMGFFLVSRMFGQATAEGMSKTSSELYSRAASSVNTDLFGWSTKDVPSSSPIMDAGNSTMDMIESTFPTLVKTAEPYFTMLGKEVRLAWTKFTETWTNMALGQGPTERAFAVVLGYAVVGLLLALYLNILTVGNARTAGRAVRNAVRQQLLVVKVAAFIFIELVIFPLGCGMVLDICTVWLFPEANIQTRAAFFVQAPLTAMFYHWVAGTMFMYSFAVLLSGCRAVMRPGAMWFIKDPQDQNSHPIRDILDRPTLTQLRKICVSGVMYSFVVACVVGSVAGLLILGNKSIMPFRWKNREPLSHVPIDLLFLHLVLPYTMRYFRPKKPIKQFATRIWKFLAAKLRLTSYFFGGRYAEEEFSWKILSLDIFKSGVPIKTVKDGSFRRVPNTDHLALPRDMRATASVNENGEPIDEVAMQLIKKQNEEAERARHSIKDDYCLVYIPPLFRYRVICFITALWIIGAILLGVAVALPIQLGRSFFDFFTGREVHDGYSLMVGFYLLWGCYLTMQAIDRLDKRRQRRSGTGPRADLRVLVFKRGLLWIAKISYMIICLGIIIPVLVAFVMELYIVLPVRLALDPDMTPKIRVVDAWALGLLYAKIALHVNRIQRPNRITRGLQHITNNGWTRPDPVQATKEVIGPLVGGLLGMIILPGAVFQAVQHFIPTIHADKKFIFMHVYPGIFMFVGLIRSGSVLYDHLSSWSQTVRDKEFLVEMRLRNHEPEKEDREKGNGTTATETVGPVVPHFLDRDGRIDPH